MKLRQEFFANPAHPSYTSSVKAVTNALTQTNGDVSKASARLGVSRTVFYRWLRVCPVLAALPRRGTGAL
jgi:transcriptional regulator of acetoin/glycerol metabolism